MVDFSGTDTDFSESELQKAERRMKAVDYEAIRNTISLYCLALDSKDFGALHHVFTPDVEAKYPYWEMKGCDEVIAKISARLKPVTTQHALTTQHITCGITPKGYLHAHVITYFTGVHLGRGRWAGQQVTAYGKYVDQVVCIPHQSKEEAGTLVRGPGAGGIVNGVRPASGKWRIRRRTVEFFGRVGEERVMEGE